MPPRAGSADAAAGREPPQRPSWREERQERLHRREEERMQEERRALGGAGSADAAAGREPPQRRSRRETLRSIRLGIGQCVGESVGEPDLQGVPRTRGPRGAGAGGRGAGRGTASCACSWIPPGGADRSGASARAPMAAHPPCLGGPAKGAKVRVACTLPTQHSSTPKRTNDSPNQSAT